MTSANAKPGRESSADDIIRIKQSTLISLNREARQLPLSAGKIRAQFNGQYQSTFKGRGMEFDESRPYQPGDDIRAMDWKVTARTGKAYCKIFREERERPVLLWVDYRQPMFFATQQHFKSVLAAKIAALLSWSAAHHGDRLGGLVFSEEQHIECRPSRGKSACLHFIKQLAQHTAWQAQSQKAGQRNGRTGISPAESLARLQHVSKPGSLIFLISDFRQMDEAAWSHLTKLSKHCDLVCISLHDPLEKALPPAGIYKITDGENELSLNTYNRSDRQAYQQRYLSHQQALQNTCRKLGIHYINISTEDDYLKVLKNKMGIKSAQPGRTQRMHK